MATITVQADNTLTLDLSVMEREVFDSGLSDQLANFITLWLSEKSIAVIRERFSALTPKQKADVYTLIKDLSSQ